MNQPARKRPQQQQQRRAKPSKPAKPVDMWRPVAPLPDPAPIVPTRDPTAMLRSLGDPPLSGKAVVAGHYVSTVIERAAMLASALAASADLLATPGHD
jgi:hypothetical protein